jgi:hypothetical protein
MEVKEVCVPLYDNMTVRCTKSTIRNDAWIIQPPIWHPHVFYTGAIVVVDQGETLEELLSAVDIVSNASNIDAQIALSQGRWSDVVQKYREAVTCDSECCICMEATTRLVFTCHRFHLSCYSCYSKNPKRRVCPLCRHERAYAEQYRLLAAAAERPQPPY